MFDKLMNDLGGTLKRGMDISLVFGKPVETQGKTIIPVSRLAGGFGGGEGESPAIPQGDNDEDAAENDNRGRGIGGGGGLHNEAIGVFEVTENYTRFIPAVQFKHILILTGMIMTFIIKLKKKKRKAK